MVRVWSGMQETVEDHLEDWSTAGSFTSTVHQDSLLTLQTDQVYSVNASVTQFGHVILLVHRWKLSVCILWSIFYFAKASSMLWGSSLSGMEKITIQKVLKCVQLCTYCKNEPNTPDSRGGYFQHSNDPWLDSDQLYSMLLIDLCLSDSDWAL